MNTTTNLEKLKNGSGGGGPGKSVKKNNVIQDGFGGDMGGGFSIVLIK